MPRNGPTQQAKPAERHYPATKARGDEIILNFPSLRHGRFVFGLADAVGPALILGLGR